MVIPLSHGAELIAARCYWAREYLTPRQMGTPQSAVAIGR
ncbi:hypothetical protein BH10ACT3_BH10ACT3_12390 [soil metagenome]